MIRACVVHCHAHVARGADRLLKSPASLRGPGLVFGVLCAGPVLAAQNPDRADQLLTVFIAQLVVLLTVSRIFGEVMQRLGQPPVMGQLLAGVALGPSGLGLIWPAAEAMLFPTTAGQREMINAVGQLGIMMMLLITGMETDLSVVKRVRRPALSASAAGIIVPFTCGVGLGWLLPDSLLPAPGRRLVTALFLGTALSIASVKVVAMVVRQMNFMRRNVGQVVLASAIVDDTVGWLIIAVTFGIALHGTVEITSLAAIAAGTALFLALSFTLGRRVVSVLIRWSNDFLHSGYAVVSMILVIGGAMSLITQFIGVHTVLGAIVAGMLIGQSPILTRHIDEQLRGLVEGLFMPVFFALSGLSADLTVLRDPRLAMLAVAFIGIASVGKFAGAMIGGLIGGMSWRESVALGCAMNARGS